MASYLSAENLHYLLSDLAGRELSAYEAKDILDAAGIMPVGEGEDGAVLFAADNFAGIVDTSAYADYEDEGDSIRGEIEQQVDSRFQQLQNKVNPNPHHVEEGQKMLERMHKQIEKNIGKFDRDMATRAANWHFEEHGDPQQAAIEGAKYARAIAQYQAGEFGAYKEGKTSQHPESLEPPKTMDQAVQRWSGGEEFEAERGLGAPERPNYESMDEVSNAWESAGGDPSASEL